MTDDYDLIVIGGGAGGLSAARAAARRGARPLLIEADRLGGDCTFTGCVPSKTLIEAAGRGETFHDAIAAVHRAVDKIAGTETADVLARQGVEVLHGRASLRGAGAIEVDGRMLRARRVVLATGTAPAVPAIPGLDAIGYLTNETVFDLTAMPASMAVVGGGAIGCEMAQAFARLGCTVTLIEGLDRLLAKEEPEASAAVEQVFRATDIDVRTGTQVVRVEPGSRGGAARLHLDDASTIDADRVLVAVGRAPATDDLGLAAAGIDTDDRGFVRTDDYLRTTARGMWAIGDITGRLQFTHVADEMGRVAVGNAFSPARKQRFRAESIPWVTFTSPEVAHVGVTEAEAPAGSRVAYLPMDDVDRAITAGRTDGFVKLIAAPRPLLRGVGGGRIVGATIVAERGGELIHEPALAMRTRMFTGRLVQTVHAYPTWSTAVRQAAAQFFLETQGRRARPAERQP